MDDRAAHPPSGARATFRAMDEAQPADWAIIGGQFGPYAHRLADRVLDHLALLRGDHGGFPIDRLDHCLQTATRAQRAGEDDDYVVMALLHDIGDTLGSYNHPDIAAAILRPFVRDELHWICQHHGIFQGYYFFHYLGLDRDLRDRFRDHPHFAATERFCALYDQCSFDRDYDHLPLDHFAPLVRALFARPVNSLYLGVADSG